MPPVFPGAPFPVFQDPNQQTVHAAAAVSASGSAVFTGYGVSEVSLFVNVLTAPTGVAPTLRYTIQEVDPGDNTTPIGPAVQTTLINAVGIQRVSLESVFGGNIKVSWVIGGTSAPTFPNVYATLVGKTSTIKITDGSSNGPAAVKPASTAAAATDPSLVVALSPASPLPAGTNSVGAVNVEGQTYQNAYPNPLYSPIGGVAQPVIDAFSNLVTRGAVTTDEGSFADAFPGASLLTALTGTLTFTNGSTSVTGAGTKFLSETGYFNYIRLTADTEAADAQVISVQSDTQLTLNTPYTGSSATGAAVKTYWQTTVASGATAGVVANTLQLVSGASAAGSARAQHVVDYSPVTGIFSAAVSQRIANQATTLGLADNPASPGMFAVFLLDGTVNTTVKVRTGFAGSTTTTNTVTLPNGATTATANLYEVTVRTDIVIFSINGIVVWTQRVQIPDAYTPLTAFVSLVNSAAVTSTTVTVDNVNVDNLDRVEIIARSDIASRFQGQMQLIDASGHGPVAVKAASTGVVTADQALTVGVSPNGAPTYSASLVGLVPPATPTDIATLTGSATKTVFPKRILISGTQTTAAVRDILLIKRSAADTGGTTVATTAVPFDSNNAAATAVVVGYTANPTALGAAVGTLQAKRVLVPTATGQAELWIIDFTTLRTSQPVALRGVTQQLALNLNSITSAGNNFDIVFEWTEE